MFMYIYNVIHGFVIFVNRAERCGIADELVQWIQNMFHAYGSDTLRKVWQSLF